MAILVGDPIVTMRGAGPDPCGVLPPPSAITPTAATGGSLPVGTYYLKFTYLTPWGETAPSSPEQNIPIGANGKINCSVASLSPGATAIRAYFGHGTPGGQSQFVEISTFGAIPGTAFNFSISAAGSASLPPSKSSAYLPDSDGNYVSAALAFRWFNLAMKKMVVQLGGIRDISGVAWPSQAAWQVLSERWTEIETIWWSGWYQWVGRQEYTWLQNPVQGVPGYATHWANAGKDIIGLWPQPGSGPGSTTLTAPLGIGDQTLNIANAGALQFPGLVQVDTEMMLISAPNQAGNQALGVVRGVSGSQAVAHLTGATVNQLITMFTGSRLAPEFAPGAAYTPLALPAGWDVPVPIFMLARFREKEQKTQDAKSLDQDFVMAVESLRTSKDAIPKDAQVGSSRVYNAFNGYQRSGALPFGILVP